MQTKNNTALAEAATVRNFYVISNNSITKSKSKLNLDPLSIFGGEDYPTFEEWFEKFIPKELRSKYKDGKQKCPVCGKWQLEIDTNQYPLIEPNYMVSLYCNNDCNVFEIWGELGFDKNSYRQIVTTQDLGYNKEKAELEIVCLADVEAEVINWLWYPYIPMGKVTMIDGDPGVGKTFLALEMCSTVSIGGSFPLEMGVINREPANTVYCVVEDGVGDTLKPRIMKMEADTKRIFAFTGAKTQQGYDVPFNLTDKFDRFEQMLKQCKPKLVIIDPLQAFIGVDMNKASETRPALQRLVKAAETHNTAIVVIRHTTKGKQQKGAFRGMGLQDILGAARSALYVGADNDNPDHKIMTHSKGNLAKHGVSLMYTIEEGKLVWKGECSTTADDLNDPDSRSREEKSAIEEALEFLEAVFKDKSRIPTKEIKKHAKDLSISESTLKRAKRTIKDSNEFDYYFDTETDGKQWYWIKCPK